jgi:RNA polymerase sigma-70 factor (ECF subfamily)
MDDGQEEALDIYVRDLLAIARNQDRAAFARLFGHFGPRVKSYLLRLGADQAQAEDLTQEVMLTVWRNALRREKRAQLDSDDPALQPEADALPDRTLDAGRWEARLSQALRELPQEQAQMLKLAYYEDRSHGDIAQSLRLPLGTVKSRLRLAIGRLRTMFGDEK